MKNKTATKGSTSWSQSKGSSSLMAKPMTNSKPKIRGQRQNSIYVGNRGGQKE